MSSQPKIAPPDGKQVALTALQVCFAFACVFVAAYENLKNPTVVWGGYLLIACIMVVVMSVELRRLLYLRKRGLPQQSSNLSFAAFWLLIFWQAVDATVGAARSQSSAAIGFACGMWMAAGFGAYALYLGWKERRKANVPLGSRFDGRQE